MQPVPACSLKTCAWSSNRRTHASCACRMGGPVLARVAGLKYLELSFGSPLALMEIQLLTKFGAIWV